MINMVLQKCKKAFDKKFKKLEAISKAKVKSKENFEKYQNTKVEIFNKS